MNSSLWQGLQWNWPLRFPRSQRRLGFLLFMGCTSCPIHQACTSILGKEAAQAACWSLPPPGQRCPRDRRQWLESFSGWASLEYSSGRQGMSLDGSFEGEQHKEGENCCIEKVINGKHWKKVLMMLKKGQNWFCLQDKGTVRAPSQLSDFGSILWALHGKWNKPFVLISITNK